MKLLKILFAICMTFFASQVYAVGNAIGDVYTGEIYTGDTINGQSLKLPTGFRLTRQRMLR